MPDQFTGILGFSVAIMCVSVLRRPDGGRVAGCGHALGAGLHRSREEATTNWLGGDPRPAAGKGRECGIQDRRIQSSHQMDFTVRCKEVPPHRRGVDGTRGLRCRRLLWLLLSQAL